MTPDSSVSFNNNLPGLLNRLGESLSAVEAYWKDRSIQDRDMASDVQATRAALNQVIATLEEFAKIPLDERKKDVTWLASFPETNPNPVLEIGLDGRIGYANPSIRKLFPDLVEQQTAHPYLAGWEGIVEKFRHDPDLDMVRDVPVGSRCYQQAIFLDKRYGRLRIYGRDITERKKFEEALKEANETLQEQADELEIQAEELQNQNEELSKSNQKLQENEEKLRDYLEGMHDLFLALGRDWRIVYANRRFAETMGFLPQDLIGKDFWQTFPNFLGTIVEKNYRQVMRDRSPAQFKPKGVYTQKWYDVFVYPTHDGIAAFISDRTEEYKARQALRESETHLSLALRNTDVTVATLDRDRRYTWVYNARHGFTPEAIIGKRPEELLPPEDVAEIVAMQERVLETGASERRVLRRLIKGQDWFYDSSLDPIKNEAGEVTGISYVAIDITERKNMENALNESLLRERTRALELETIMDTVPAIIWVSHDPECRQMTGNRYSYQFLGIGPGTNVSMSALLEERSYLHKAYKNGQEVTPSQMPMQISAITGKPSLDYEFDVQFEDGSLRHLFGNAYPLCDEDGRPNGAVGAFIDITERIHAEERLAYQAELLARVHDAIVATDDQMRITYWNKTAEEIFGWTEQEAVGRYTNDLFQTHFPDSTRQEALNGLLNNVHYEGEVVYRCKNGSYIQAHSRSAALRGKGGEFIGLVTSVRDVTERKRLEQELQEANTLLEQRVRERTRELQSANEELELTEEELKVQNDELEKTLAAEKSLRLQLIQAEKYAALARLVGSVAHEINNPIQTVKNCLYLIRSESLPEDASSIVGMAESELQRIGNLVQQLRETYRPTNLQPVDFNLIDVLNRVYALMVPQMRQNNVQWQMDHVQDDITLHGIPDQIQQVCLNICLNAIDAMGSKGGQLEIGVSLPAGEKKVQISFHDTGPGIPKDIVDQIFEPFFTTKVKGTGLGLSICYEIVKSHGGDITVESRPGEGATFYVWLPIQ